MMNQYDEVVERDLDDEIQLRKELIEKAKEIQELPNWNAIQKEISNLQRKWKRIPYYESACEDELAEEFDEIINNLYAKRREGFESNKAIKEELVRKTKAIMNSKDFNHATKLMNDYMAEWKTSGTVGNKEEDDALWESFNEARQTFFDNKHKHWEETKVKFENARVTKEGLIAQAKELVESTDWTKTNETFKELLNEWKAAGNSGKENDDRLWNEFNGYRQAFFDRRGEHYEQLHAEQKERLEAKKGLVAQAKELVDAKDYSRANTEKIMSLSTEWKQIGNAGKEENEVWKEFRTLNDEYFAGLREHNEHKHLEWRARMQDVRARKQELLNNQKRQLKRLQDSMVGLISQREVDDVQDRIEDKKDFIAEIEADIADIDAKLAK